MSSYHKPKVFRSVDGCCICKAKSSSSRFTDSGKYESAFTLCFKINDTRMGDICNACVLIVKRWRNLPQNTQKNWNHVVDSRVGPGGSKVTFRNVKKRPEPVVTVAPVVEKFEKIRRKKSKLTRRKPEIITENTEESHENVPGFIDLSYFTRRSTCCGVIYEGMAGEIIIDQNTFKRCQYHSSSSASTTSLSTSAASLPSPVAATTTTVLDKHLAEDSDDNVDDTDSISFYSDDTSVSKNVKDDLTCNTDTDEGFFDKSELRRHLMT